MDRLVYIAASGVARTLEHQAALSNNMANVSTNGFRAQLAAYRSVPITLQGQNPAATTRVGAVAITANSILAQGPLQTTGRDLDVAIDGEGWFAVQTPEGEAYTRAGSLRRDRDGMLVTAKGHLVLSVDGQPIDLADSGRISFDRQGGVNVLAKGARAQDIQRVAQLKLVTPDRASLVRGDDGLFRSLNAEGQAQVSPHSALVSVVGGALEGSNVSAVETMIGLIQNARRFEMQMKMIADVNHNEQKANSILSSAG